MTLTGATGAPGSAAVRIALVTGASRGIGRALALRAGRDGWTLVLVGRRLSAALEATAREVEAAGGKAFPLAADVSDPEQVAELARQVGQHWGRLDVLVNNAGVARRRTIDEVTLEEWAESLNVNLTGTFLVTQALLPCLRRGEQPAIVNVASIAGRIGGKVGPHYAAAKGGVVALTKQLAGALVDEGIRVNCVAPDLTDTEMLRELGIQPGGGRRLGRPEEVAEAIYFLAQPGNSFLNGECVHLTGGKQYYE